MTISSAASGTQTAVIGTEHTLATVSTAGTYVLAVDTVNLANGDVVELRLKTKALSGGTERVYVLGTYAHAQGDNIKMSIPAPMLYSGTFTLKQTAGTGRNFDWNVIAL